MNRLSKLGRTRANGGVGLLEVVIGIGIVTGSLGTLVGGFLYYVKNGLGATDRIQAAFLIEEGLSAVRYLRNESWSGEIATLTNGQTYYIATTSDGYVLSTSPQAIPAGFTRTIVLSAVSRDGNDDIASSGTNDPDTRRVDVAVSWDAGTATATTYITDLYDD